MGELIRRESASAPLRFSGERLTSDVSDSQVGIEHHHRYLFARDFCRGRDVLDVASGEGYGTALLAQVARSAIGIEIDAAAVAGARNEFARPNLRYEEGDARALPLPDASIDVAVSFETLEHILEHDVFLSELRRVLRPGGILLMSTPDRDIYSAAGTPPNPYHVLELTRAEFEVLLRRHFVHAVFLAQRAVIGTIILGASGTGATRFFERRSDTLIEASDGLPRAPYLIALASDGDLPALHDSAYIHRSDLDTDVHARAEAETRSRAAEASAKEASRRADALKEEAAAALARAEAAETRSGAAEASAEAAIQCTDALKEEAAALRARAKAAVEAGKHAEAELLAREGAYQDALGQKDAEIARHKAQAAQAEDDLQAAFRSTSWRLTAPLRSLGSHSPVFARSARRVVKLAWWTVTLQIRRRYRAWRKAQHARREEIVRLPPGPRSRSREGSPATPIAVPFSEAPVVSVIIATYGKVDFTRQCLASIALHSPRLPVEVIVVDDAYPGADDVASFADIKGIRFIRNTENRGFLLSCNGAAHAARGEFLYFLNNDTEVMPGAIDALADLLRARPDAGMVGSKLLFPDGRLQEAGGIVWDDASGWNYGRGEDPGRPEYSYVREVDYCSGASIMVRRELFEQLGGFDERFVPAYCEDSDLAFRIRTKGYKVVLEPRSVVIHYEGVSHGTDLTQGIKAYQTTNQERFLERWRDTLARENFPPGLHVLRARDRARNRRVILVIDHYVPEPDRDAGSRTAKAMLECLGDAGWVVKFWPHNRLYSPIYTPPLEMLGVEVLDQRWPGDLSAWMDENGGELDHVMIMRPQIAEDVVHDVIKGTSAVLSYYGHDIHFLRMQRQFGLMEDPELPRNAASMERLERRLWRQFDVVTYPSEEEAAVVRSLSPHTIARAIVPFCYDTRTPRTKAPQARSVLFVAGFAHPPNIDAAIFFVGEVMPRLLADVPDVRVVLAGSNPTPEVRALAGPSVDVTGYITDAELARLYDECRVAVVPLRFGAGVKGKVAEALSCGLPLVTSPVGAQGMEGLESVVFVRESAREIADALKVLLTDDAAWMAQSGAQMAFARLHFSRTAMTMSLLAALTAGEAARRPADKTCCQKNGSASLDHVASQVPALQ